MSSSRKTDTTKSSVSSNLSPKDRLLIKTVEILVPPLSRLYLGTVKTTVINPHLVQETKERYGSFICAFWHNRIIPMLWAHRNSGVVCLVSPSKDGEIIARILHRFGYKTVRGSSFKKPIAGSKALVRALRKGNIVAVIPDGPRGPLYSVNPGVLHLSLITKAPILPATAVITSYWEVNSWDRFRIPKPFSKMIVGYANPIFINDKSEIKQAEERLKVSLKELESKLASSIEKRLLS